MDCDSSLIGGSGSSSESTIESPKASPGMDRDSSLIGGTGSSSSSSMSFRALSKSAAAVTDRSSAASFASAPGRASSPGGTELVVLGGTGAVEPEIAVTVTDAGERNGVVSCKTLFDDLRCGRGVDRYKLSVSIPNLRSISRLPRDGADFRGAAYYITINCVPVSSHSDDTYLQRSWRG